MNIAPWFFLEVWLVLGGFYGLLVCVVRVFFSGNSVPLRYTLYWSSRGWVNMNALLSPFCVVRPLFYGNNAPLRYALYWSSREADYASGELQ